MKYGGFDTDASLTCFSFLERVLLCLPPFIPLYVVLIFLFMSRCLKRTQNRHLASFILPYLIGRIGEKWEQPLDIESEEHKMEKCSVLLITNTSITFDTWDNSHKAFGSGILIN